MFRILIIVICSFFISCSQDYSPKPRGYFRIELPEKKYELYSESCPFSFMKPIYANVVPDSSKDTEPCWLNIDFPQFKAKVHLSYKDINGKKLFNEVAEDSRQLAFKHTIKAVAINETMIRNAKNKVYGIYYDIEGNTASSLQFYLTDSTRHYLRGALYFSAEPQIDSLKPVLEFIRQDIDVMIGSFEWKN